MRIRVGDIELNCIIEHTKDLPWLILSNSIATNLSMWDEVATSLSEYYRVVRYDQRGHGRSDAPSGMYSIELLAEDLLALMDMLGIEKATLVGISMGGMTVLSTGKKYPDRIEKLVVCDCGPAASPASAAQWQDRIKKVSQDGMASIVEETIGRWFTPEALAAPIPVVEKVADMVRTTPAAGFIGCAGALSMFDLRSRLEDLKIQSLFVAGEHDAVIGGTKQLHEMVPNSQFRAIPNAGHLCNLENPEAFLAVLKDFLLDSQNSLVQK